MPCDYAPDYAKNHECENGEIVKRTSAWRNCPTTLIEHGFSPDWGQKRPCCFNRLPTFSRLPNCRKLERVKGNQFPRLQLGRLRVNGESSLEGAKEDAQLADSRNGVESALCRVLLRLERGQRNTSNAA
jgi:hypothetical protein